MLNFNDISLLRGQRVLFADVSFTWHDKHKIGLIGANGSGKTSLFSLLLGDLEPSSGNVSYQGQLRIAYVEQEIQSLTASAIDYVLQGDDEYASLKHNIAMAEESGEYDQLAELHANFAAIDGYSCEARGSQLLAGLGFDQEAQKKSVESFSGGWRMRLNLARALMCRSDILLLDEPTNHLDLDAILWLEKWLQQYAGLLVVISHDRDFLDTIVTQIAHIEAGSIKLYEGNYSIFEAERARQLALQQATYEKQQRQIKHLMKFVDRFRYKATKAKQAQSRLKSIERMDTVAAVQVSSPFHFDFKTPDKLPYPILKMEEVDLGYADQTILANINWQLTPGDRVALLGPNGAGKSTLMKALAGGLDPLKGTFQLDSSVKIGYFAQHQIDALHYDKTAFEHMQLLSKKSSTQELRNYLGGFGFHGDEALKDVGHFSGGEKARLALAMIVWQRPNLLLLDEPTNHLDIEMRMALTMALQSFEGALVLVSHDRYLINNCVDRLWLVSNGSLKLFEGDTDDYKRWVLEYYRVRQKSGTLDKDVIDKSAEVVKSKKANPIKVAALEKRIAELEAELKDIVDKLNDPKIYDAAFSTERETLFEQQKTVQQELEKAEEEWLSAQS